MGARRPRVGLLDLDIFGPSIPKLMGLESAEKPNLTSGMFTLHNIRMNIGTNLPC